MSSPPSGTDASRMYAGTQRNPALAALAARQGGAIRREQLTAVGVSSDHTAHQVTAQRWSEWGRDVILLQNSAPTRWQLMWVAVLDAGSPAALGSHTALELVGFRGFAKESRRIHLIVPRGAKCAALPGVQVHESRRFQPEDVTRHHGMPLTRPPRSAIDAATWQRWPRFACALLAAAVQQRVSTHEQLAEALAEAGHVRHKAHMQLALADIAGGAESMGEIDVAGLCRRYRLVQPTRQRQRRDASGRLRYLDCEWELPDGSVVVLEIDGSHHLSVEHWEADIKRERGLVIGGDRVLRATVSEVRLEAAALAADLVAIGVPLLPSELSERGRPMDR